MLRPADPRPARRILLIKPSSLGDIVHALPVLAALRHAYPDAHIAWLVGSSFAGLLAEHPLINEVIPFDRRRYGRMLTSPSILREFLAFVGDLRRRRFDLVVDLQGLVRSGFMAWATGAKRRIGFADAREMAWAFYSQRVAVPGNAVHAVDKNCALASEMGLQISRPEFPLPITPRARTAMQDRLSAAGLTHGRFIAVLPGARWESKRWTAEKFAELLCRLAATDPRPCVLLGAPDERPFAEQIRAAGARAIDLVGSTSLAELAAALDLAEVVVSHDSGPMHVAAALGRPIVALFGPTDSRKTGPYQTSAHVLTHSVPCAPCMQRVCPLGHQNCLRGLEIEAVLRAVRELAPPPQDAARSAEGLPVSNVSRS